MLTVASVMSDHLTCDSSVSVMSGDKHTRGSVMYDFMIILTVKSQLRYVSLF